MTEEILKQNLLLKQIDKNSNQEISVDEIKFFSRNQENILLLSQDLHKNDTNIKKTFEINLYDAYKDISKKKKLTTDEQLILQLYQKVFEKKITEKPNLSRIEYNINTEFNNIINWVKSVYPNEYNTLVENQTKIYEQKPEWERNEYIKYNTIFWAIGKYQQELQAENDILLKKNWFYEKMEIVLDPRIGKKELLETYWWREYFTCSTFFEWIAANQYPEYQKDQTILDTYNKEISNILQQFWYKNANVFQKDGQKYKEYTKEASKLSKEYNYEESIKYLKKHDSPEDDSQEKIKKYFDHVETTLKYSEAHDNLSQKYDKNTILKYQNTINEINKTQKKYPTFLDAIQRLSAYNKILQQKKNELNITDYVLTRYSTYVQDVKNSWIQTRSEKLTKMKILLEKEINGDSKNDFIFPNIKKGLAEQAKKQEQTDKIWNAIKTVPEVYTVVNFLVGAWNGVVDATISVWTWLGVLIMSAYKDEHQLITQSDRAQKRNDFLKIGQSTTQKEPPVKDGKWNLNFDNGAAQLWSSVANMLILLSGAGAIARWATAWWVKLGLNISQNIATKWWLFTRATMQGLPSSFQEALNQNIDKGSAWQYAITQTLVSSSLEMLAPNDMFFGNPSIKWVLKQLGKEQWAKTLAKAFAKNISKEMVEEVTQESLQFAAERVINKITNDITDAQFETSMTWADFGTTAVLTALTTGIVSSNGSYDMAKIQTNTSHLKQWIVSDEVRFNEYKQKLKQIINDKVDIGISSQQANDILQELEITKNILNWINKNNWSEEGWLEIKLELVDKVNSVKTEASLWKWEKIDTQKEMDNGVIITDTWVQSWFLNVYKDKMSFTEKEIDNLYIESIRNWCIDHHSIDSFLSTKWIINDCCSSMMVMKYSSSVLELIRAKWIHSVKTHTDVDFDAIVSSYLTQSLIQKWKLPSIAPEIAELANKIDYWKYRVDTQEFMNSPIWLFSSIKTAINTQKKISLSNEVFDKKEMKDLNWRLNQEWIKKMNEISDIYMNLLNKQLFQLFDIMEQAKIEWKDYNNFLPIDISDNIRNWKNEFQKYNEQYLKDYQNATESIITLLGKDWWKRDIPILIANSRNPLLFTNLSYQNFPNAIICVYAWKERSWWDIYNIGISPDVANSVDLSELCIRFNKKEKEKRDFIINKDIILRTPDEQALIDNRNNQPERKWQSWSEDVLVKDPTVLVANWTLIAASRTSLLTLDEFNQVLNDWMVSNQLKNKLSAKEQSLNPDFIINL
jgi:hypothetical protein